jgi:peptidyl-prolyl cis-trans isomerase SurA
MFHDDGKPALTIQIRRTRTALRFTLAALGGSLAVAAVAQTVTDVGDVSSAASLNLPGSVTLFGKADPHLRKATAIVNGYVITGTDVDQRLALVILANQGRISDEERERLRLQVLRNLIDETLQIQEAKAHDVEIAPGEVQQSYERVAARFKRTPAQMSAYLREQGSSDRSIKRQILGELAWNRLLRRRVEPTTNVSEADVQAIIERMKASKGTKEFHIGEIYLSATPENATEVQTNGRKIIEQIRQGGSFAAYARQFSEASTAPVGGDLGWVRAAQLPDALAQAAQEIQVGQIAGPIPIPGGFSIVYLVDTRQIGMADPRDAILNLRQMSIKFEPGITQAQATARAESFAKATSAMQGCGKAAEVAASQNAEVVDNDQVKVRDLPAQLQDMMLKMSVGQVTQPFGSPTEGVRVFVLCGRDEPADASIPTPDQVRGPLEEARVNQRALRYLRDLRRDAVVDYR